jgi:hypothetical protein
MVGGVAGRTWRICLTGCESVRSIHVPIPRAEHTTTRVDMLDIRSVVVVEVGEYPARRAVARRPLVIGLSSHRGPTTPPAPADCLGEVVVTLGCGHSGLFDADGAYGTSLADHIAVAVLQRPDFAGVRDSGDAVGHHAAAARSARRDHCPMKSILSVRVQHG